MLKTYPKLAYVNFKGHFFLTYPKPYFKKCQLMPLISFEINKVGWPLAIRGYNYVFQQ